MAAPKSTVWPLDPHTSAKHAILKRYLDAWLPILSHAGFERISYVDGFAGPGSYLGGEDGSPILALKALRDHPSNIAARCSFHFVERDKERCAALAATVDQTIGPEVAAKFVAIHNSDFVSAFPTIKRHVQPGGKSATFAFIDPFGWTGMPFAIIAEILEAPSSEVLINFMFEEINRFLDHPDQLANFDTLFGCNDWRQLVPLSGRDRNAALRDLYARQLSTKARYVRYFEMRNKNNATDYFLFFATNSLRGLQKMKEAMWKVDEIGQFTFSDATDQNQIVLFAEPDLDLLKRQILQEFSGRRVRVDAVEEFVVVKTAFRESHYKSVLKGLEAASPQGLEIINPKLGRRRGTFPSGTVVAFSKV